jgi:type IX secretion system substrate protein
LGSQSGVSRWGDYSCMSVDPSDDSTFWFTTEYRKTGNWATWISSFDFAPFLAPVITMNNEDTICSYSYYNAVADVVNQISIQWETSGDGIFNNPNSASTTYAHGQQDLQNGSATLTLTALGYEPDLFSVDSTLLTINNKPDSDAGSDTLICEGDYAYLHGTVVGSSSVEWTTEGDGTFEDNLMGSTTYVPGTEDVANGSVKLSLMGFPIPPCVDTDTDKMTLTIDECTGLNEFGVLEDKITIRPNPAKNEFVYQISGLKEGKTKISILNLQGQAIFQTVLVYGDETISRQIDTRHFAKGTYIFRVEQQGMVLNKKLIVQ